MLIRVPGQAAMYGYIPVFCNMKVYCVFSLETPHRGDSNKDTQYTFFKKKKKKDNRPKLSEICSNGIFRRVSRTSSKQLS